MKKMHHTRENYMTQIKTICRETNTEIVKGIEKFSDYYLLTYLNVLLAKNNCVVMNKEELEFDLQ